MTNNFPKNDNNIPDLSVNSVTKTVVILGAGTWGSALARLASHNSHSVHIWSRRLGNRLEDILADANFLVSAISMKGVAAVSAQIQAIGLPNNIPIVTATKGLDPESTRTPSQIWSARFPQHPIVVLSGPNLSKEITQNLPAATVVASQNQQAAQLVQEVFASNRFRVYTSSDPLGTELGGTLKNVIAIAAGVCDGLHLGTNAKSGLLTRALTEIIRIGTHLGGQKETFFGLSGLGDMLATCNSSLSRNYRVGYGLAQGQKLDNILEDLGTTAEGVNTTNVLLEIAKREKINVPISWQVYCLLHQKITPQQAVEALMERDLKPEFYDQFNLD